MRVLAVRWSRMYACVLATFPARAWGFLLPREWLLVRWDVAPPISWVEAEVSATLSRGHIVRRPFWWIIAEVTLRGPKMERKRPHPHPLRLYTSSPCRLEPVLALLTTARPHSVFQNQLVLLLTLAASALAAYFNPRILTLRPLSVSVWLPLHICSNLQILRAESR